MAQYALQITLKEVMKFNEEILNTALLGTQRKALDPNALPTPLKSIIQKANTGDKEDFFYRAIALLNQYEKAGNLDVLLDLPTTKPAKDETQPYINALETTLIQEMLQEEKPHFFHFLAIFLDKIIIQNKIIPPSYLVSLMNLGVKNSAYQKKIQKIIGNRGYWLASFEEQWAKIYLSEEMQPHENSLWEQENVQDIYQDLVEIRKIEPLKVTSLLQEKWNQLTPNHKILLIDTLQEGLSTADEPFLLGLLADLDSRKTAHNPKNQQLRTKIVSWLMDMHASALSQEIWTNLKTYIGVEKGQIVFNLPKESDEFFCKEVMWLRLGLLEESPSVFFSYPQAALYELLKRIPFGLLVQHTGIAQRDLLHQFHTHKALCRKEGKNVFPLYTRAICKSFGNLGDAQGFFDWLNTFKMSYKLQNETYCIPFLHLVPSDVMEEIYTKHVELTFQHEDAWVEGLFKHLTWEWSLHFSVHLLKKLFETRLDVPYAKHTPLLASKIIPRLHPKAFAQISPTAHQETKSTWHISNYSQIYYDMKRLIEFYEKLQNIGK